MVIEYKGCVCTVAGLDHPQTNIIMTVCLQWPMAWNLEKTYTFPFLGISVQPYNIILHACITSSNRIV